MPRVGGRTFRGARVSGRAVGTHLSGLAGRMDRDGQTCRVRPHGTPAYAHTAAEGVHMQDRGAAELAWEMFEKTGNFTYYMLYKRLKG